MPDPERAPIVGRVFEAYATGRFRSVFVGVSSEAKCPRPLGMPSRWAIPAPFHGGQSGPLS